MSLKSSLMTLPKHFNQTYLYGIKNKNIVVVVHVSPLTII